MNQFIQKRLLLLAFVYLALQALIITLSPAVRLRSWDADFRFTHWIALGLWGLAVSRAHHDISRKLPDADPYLFPAAAFISGWGILAIWRLDPLFGLRQAIWFAISVGLLALGTRLGSVDFFRRYKYILLTGGLIITAFTLIFGTNPSGNGPRLWLGWGELYLQPSEPLKLLLLIFLAAYFSDKLPAKLRTIHILFPTVILGGIVLMLLVFQRDFGTAAIFTAIYTVIIYLAMERNYILIAAALVLTAISYAGYALVGIVHSRMDSWLNPWVDPTGSSFQIIQSLIAIANGGLFGRGPGLGNPNLIPVAISDFIYAVMAEETGLIGTLGLLAIIGLILSRGLRTALRAPSIYRRLLAAGITAYLGLQTILIVGGNIRLLPLTGVTLPFVSYGGSSLLTSFVALLILIHISNHLDVEPAPLPKSQPYIFLGGFLSLGLFACALANGWWSIIRGPDLLTRADNQRRLIEERYVPRGLILDSSNSIITTNSGEIGTYQRLYKYVDLAPITGYTDPVYGQAGLEASMDEYLNGTKGTPMLTYWWNNLLFGTNPPGLDIRLSIDLYLQSRADEMMLGHRGAVVLMNAQSGEILVMASHPTFNPNHLSEIGSQLNTDPDKPLINRATQGQYITGNVMTPFVQALYGDAASDGSISDNIYDAFGFHQMPQIQLPTASAAERGALGDAIVRVSPLQMVLAAAALSNGGQIPAPRLVMAVDTPTEGWVTLSALGMPMEVRQATAWNEAMISYLSDDQTYWSHVSQASESDSSVTWFIGGTPPNWGATPLTIVVVVEEANERLANRIGSELLIDAMHP